jgi:hypothetical protein
VVIVDFASRVQRKRMRFGKLMYLLVVLLMVLNIDSTTNAAGPGSAALQKATLAAG